MGKFSLGIGKDCSSIRSRVRHDLNGGGYVSCFNELERDNELFSMRPGTTKGSNNSRYFCTRVEIIFNMETCRVTREGKGKTPMSKESLRIPSPTLSRLYYPRKGTSFVATLWRSRVISVKNQISI
jgi:hypothetical protein